MRPDCKAILPLVQQSKCGELQIPADRQWCPEQEHPLRISTLDSIAEGTPIFSSYNPLYSLAGFLVGALVGMTGVGGGSLMTPILVLLFNFHPVTAVGTELLYASVTKTVGTAVHGKRQTVDLHIVGGLRSEEL